MNALTYSHRIANEFGGFRKEELLTKLQRLMALYEKTHKSKMNTDQVEKPKQETPQRIVATKDEIKYTIQQILKNNNHESIYTKVSRIIIALPSGIYFPLSIIPDDLLVEFLKIADGMTKIQFNGDAEDQYFIID